MIWILIFSCDLSSEVEKTTIADTAILEDFDGDGYFSDEDCDDSSNVTNPGAVEICDGADNNCDGVIDEGVQSIFYADVDGDGFGIEDEMIEACSPEEGFVSNGNDCDDSNADIYPGTSEVCDGLDNNCDDVIDGDDAIDKQEWFQDLDGDGFGSAQSLNACFAPSGYVDQGTDCDDSNADIFPGAEEVCNARDDDCDLEIDEETPAQTWYPDADEDGFGDNTAAIISCEPPQGYILLGGDCDDADSDQFPNSEEYCNNEDDDCDGNVDEGSLDPSIWYADLDGDGFGDPTATSIACEAPPQYVADLSDCDDGDVAKNPNADEVCNDEDDNCDGVIDEGSAVDASDWYADADGDGFGNAATLISACEAPLGHLVDASDCDDTNENIYPDALEICNALDDNCDGITDGSDSWADTAQPYRIPFTVTGGSFSSEQSPIVMDVNFRDALDSLGDSSSFNPNDLRIMSQDCGIGTPEIPSQFLDSWLGIMSKSSDINPIGDEEGTVAFLFDLDGDYSTKELLAAGDVHHLAVYFGGGLSAPMYSTPLVATSSQIATGASTVDFLDTAGGMISSVTIGSSPSLMSQVDSCCGNGPYISSWNVDPQDAAGQLTLLEEGPIFAAVEATGERGDSSGSYSYSYVYWMFAHRPEIYSKVHQVTTSAMTVSHPGSWVSGLRPWESIQSNITTGATFSN
ncbi:MAG: hypothetical protein CL916_13760, partial [Deltaproteobacteria bacterium]|nr:hypothetical protein [Deltaproteobacteria bacterium]